MGSPWRRQLISLLALAALLTPLELLLTQAPAGANFTPSECDSVPKYWCFTVYYTPNPGYVNVGFVSVTGGTGYGGAKSWQRYITSVWQNPPGTGTWYDLLDYAPQPNVPPGYLYTDPPTWYTDQTVNLTFANAFPNMNVSDNAVVQVRTRYESNVDPRPAGQLAYPPWCGHGVDFHLSEGGYYVVWATTGC